MLPNARNSIRNKEKQVADKLSTLLAPIDIDMRLVAFFLSTLPANSQLRFVDLLMAYVSIAKDSDVDPIRAWAISMQSDA